MNKFTIILIIMIFSIYLPACKEKSSLTAPSDEKSPISQYTGVWKGTTGQSLPIYFRVTETGLIDSLTIRIRMNLPTFTCTATFTKDSVVILQGNSFVMPVILNGSSVNTRVWVTLSTADSAQGTYDYHGGSFALFCGSTFTMGTAGSIISRGTLQVTKENSSPTGGQSNVSGTWYGSYSSNLLSSVSITLNLIQDANNITGTFHSTSGGIGSVNGSISGNNVTFSLIQTTQGCPGNFGGNAIVSGDNMTFTFIGSDCLGSHSNGKGQVTRDKTPLVINSTVPSNNSQGVSTNTVINVNFSKEINTSTVTNSTFTLKDGSGNFINGIVTASGKTVTFTPTTTLTSGTAYTATITTAIKDWSGISLALNYIWNFTTGSSSSGGSGNFLAWTSNDDPSHSFTLVRVNGQTGVVTNIGGNNFFTSLQYAHDGTLYGLSNELHIINPENGSSVKIGKFNYPGKSDFLMIGAAFSPTGALYAKDGLDSVYTVNLSNASLTYVGMTTEEVWDIEFSSTGTMYAAFQDVFILNPSDLSTQSKIGSTSAYLFPLTFGSQGTLYSINVFPSTTLYSVNLNTGQATAVTNINSAGLTCLVAEKTNISYPAKMYGIAKAKYGFSHPKTKEELLALEKTYKGIRSSKLKIPTYYPRK